MRHTLLVIFMLFTATLLKAQSSDLIGRDLNTITTAVPFLLISPDPVGSAMGDCGVATDNDVYSLFWNPAKYAANDGESTEVGKDFKIGVSYSPWLRILVKDIWLGSVYASKRVSSKSVVSGSFRYFLLGDLIFTNVQGNVVGSYLPLELATDIAWSQKLTEHWHGAVALRYIHSNLTNGQQVAGTATKPGNSIAADLAVYYERKFDDFNTISFGANISNIGSKISYSDDNRQRDFIPTILRLGPSFKFIPDKNNQIRISLEFNKLLVPTPPYYATDSTGQVMFDSHNEPIIIKGMSSDVSVLGGMFQSFYDAPDGFREELREVTYGLGFEYKLFQVVSFRGGYFNEHATKGNRKFVTAGLGVKYRFIEGNFARSYVVEQLNPLKKTWRLSLAFDLAGVYR